MGTWKKFWRLKRGDRRLALEAATMILATRVALRLVGYRRWESLLAGISGTLQQDVDPAVLARMVASASRNLFFQPTCLERSLALWWMLRRRGSHATVHIGGRKQNGEFEAHAWVECDGIALNDMDEGEYSRFAAFDDSRALTARSTR